MDWGIDPERISELNAIAQARRFSARESELFVLAIVGGGANSDIPLWDLLTVAFGLGWLTSKGRYGPRDAAVNCLLDQSDMALLPLRHGPGAVVEAAGARIVGGPKGIEVHFAGDDGPARSFAWSRVRMCLALGDFLFMSASPKPGTPDGMQALNVALDAVFSARAFDQALLKRGIQEPARFMRAWRRRYLPLQLFADLVRERESYLAERGRTAVNRDLDADDVFALWRFTRERGATWPYARYLEKLACLMREERQGSGRRGFIDAGSLDDLAGHEPFHNPEDAILEWLDLARSQIEARVEVAAAPAQGAPGLPANDAGRALENPYDAEDGPELAEERSVLALMQLPETPKFLTGEQRQQIASVLALQPVAYDLPLALLRAQATREWENRLVEATRRAAGGNRPPVNTAPPSFDYRAELDAVAEHAGRADQLVQVGFSLGAPGAIDPDREAGVAILKKLQRDRASFRLETPELAQIFTEAQGPLLTVSRALRQIMRRGEAYAARADLVRQARADQAAFATVLSQPAAAGI